MSEIDFKALQNFFDVDEIEWRLQQAGEKNGKVWAICVPYVTNRAIQQRLDDVVGPGSWKNEFKPGPGGGVLCGISIRVGEEWVTKWDGAENTDIEEVKGGLSGAMKRAAVQWGVGRYLYRLEESFANVSENGKLRGKTKDGKPFRWDPPQLPAWALLKREKAAGSGRKKEESLARVRQEHEAMLEFIKAVGPQVDEGAEMEVGGRVQNLKAFVRENWTGMKEQVRLTRAVVEAIEQATGVHFEREAA
ncbi:MAG TPA: Rad52/Rad22 family DNA repair protein [Longimicrobiaceae bacterium]|nr:Rad52/Rad22 family DNA repair protein [Longimicrobiaceae bacterium]